MKKNTLTRFVQDALGVASKMGVYLDDSGEALKMDAGESLFFERELESVEQRLYETKLRELKYRKLIPVSNRDGAGAETITYYQWTRVGMAKIIANPSDDLPRVDLFAKRFTQNVYSIGTAFGFSTQELRAAAMAGRPLEMFKVDAARRAVHEKENDIAWNGETDYNLPGFLNNVNIPTVQAPLNGGASSRLWINKSPDEILADVKTMVSGIHTSTNRIHSGNTLLLTSDNYDHIAMTPRSSLSDTTILEFILQKSNTYGIDTIDWLKELEGAGTGASNMHILYENTDEVLEQRIPLEMINHPPQIVNLEFKVPVEARNGGVVVRYPLACRTMYDV